MKAILILLLFLVSVFIGCSQNSREYKQGRADMQYLIHHDEPGPTIKQGDFLSVHFIHRTEEDSLLASSYQLDQPTFLEHVKPVFKGDIFDGLALLSEGDSATFKLNFDSMQTALNVMKPLTTKSNTLYFTVKVEKVISKGNLSNSVFEDEVSRFYQENALKSMKEEPGKLGKYIALHKLKPEVTPSGLKYIIVRKGSGPSARKGDSVKFKYTGMLAATGKVFISNNSDTVKKYGYIFQESERFIPSKVATGSGTIIPGLDEALLLFPKGTKATLIIPSKLAYGGNGQNIGLPPYAPLIFEIEII